MHSKALGNLLLKNDGTEIAGKTSTIVFSLVSKESSFFVFSVSGAEIDRIPHVSTEKNRVINT